MENNEIRIYTLPDDENTYTLSWIGTLFHNRDNYSLSGNTPLNQSIDDEQNENIKKLYNAFIELEPSQITGRIVDTDTDYEDDFEPYEDDSVKQSQQQQQQQIDEDSDDESIHTELEYETITGTITPVGQTIQGIITPVGQDAQQGAPVGQNNTPTTASLTSLDTASPSATAPTQIPSSTSAKPTLAPTAPPLSTSNTPISTSNTPSSSAQTQISSSPPLSPSAPPLSNTPPSPSVQSSSLTSLVSDRVIKKIIDNLSKIKSDGWNWKETTTATNQTPITKKFE